MIIFNNICPRDCIGSLGYSLASALSVATFTLVLASCDRDAADRQSEKAQTSRGQTGVGSTQTTLTPRANPPSFDGLAHLLKYSMKDSIASDGSNWVSRRDEFRKGVVALAAKEGIPPMAVAERLIANAQSEVEHDKIVSAIRDCFRGFEWDIALIKELPAGRLRSGIINGLASGLERQDRDLVGLKTLYDAVPVGAARADVAAAGARLTVELKGLPAGLEYIAGLEMPEERFAAFREINTKENFGDSGDQKEIQEKCDAIVETFPPRQRAIYRYLRGKGR